MDIKVYHTVFLTVTNSKYRIAVDKLQALWYSVPAQPGTSAGTKLLPQNFHQHVVGHHNPNHMEIFPSPRFNAKVSAKNSGGILSDKSFTIR